MKGRESGMPDADYWNTFFDAPGILKRLRVAPGGDESVVEFGGGYGTFTLPLARMTTGKIVALDIEPELVTSLGHTARAAGLGNVDVIERDFVSHGTGLADSSVDRALLFNILHIEDPVGLLREAHRVLKPGGTAAVIHWRRDIDTPRGPSMDIRPSPEQCADWARQAGFWYSSVIDLGNAARWHFGLILSMPAQA
ncbi:MAG: class I SAM-dependent methyltransferase [Gammaproteobacteria bacterium]